MVTTLNQVKAFNFYGGNYSFYHARDKELLASGPAGTGKTLAALLKVHDFATNFPGSRHLIVRKTRSALTESALVTLERDIYEFSHPCMFPLNQRKVRQSYKYPNGSEVIIGGMDKPEKTLSTEYDIIYIQEATELDLDEYETLFRSLRAGKIRFEGIPFSQIMMDCNPTYPHHWLYKRFTSGRLKNYTSTLHCNPRFWNINKSEWTQDGIAYLDTLKNLTGIRRKRFLEGVWAAAEGLVFDSYDATIHNLPQSWEPPKEWRRYHSIDFGHTNPMVYQYWAEDGDGRLYLYKERYETKRLVEDLGKQVRDELATYEPRPQFVVGDHDAEDRATFEKHSGLKIRPADKRVNAGIDMVNSRMVVQKDGKPRIFFRERACVKTDQSLMDAGKPTCTMDELVSYVWEPDKDKPVKENDHGSDAMRYLVAELDGKKRVMNLGVR